MKLNNQKQILLIFFCLSITYIKAQGVNKKKNSPLKISVIVEDSIVNINFKNHSNKNVYLFSSYFEYWNYRSCLLKVADTSLKKIVYDFSPRIIYLIFEGFLNDRIILNYKRIHYRGQIKFEYILLNPRADTTISFKKSIIMSKDKFANESGRDCTSLYSSSLFNLVEMKFSYFNEKMLNEKKQLLDIRNYKSILTSFSF